MEQVSTRPASRVWHWSTIALVCADLAALALAIVAALVLRFESDLSRVGDSLATHRWSLVFGLIFYIAVFARFRMYRYAWRFASLEMVWGIVLANTIGLVGMIALQAIFTATRFPLSVLAMQFMLGVGLVGCVRIGLRWANLRFRHQEPERPAVQPSQRPRRVVILGAGAEGAHLLSMLHEDVRRQYQIIGFLDDNPTKQGIYVRGVRVLGPLSHLYQLLATSAVDEVLIRLPESAHTEIREYVMACRRQQVPVKVIPSISEHIHGRPHARLEDITVEDLLRRPPVRTNLGEVGDYVHDRCILVTGAGGSIGSELCRQLLALAPSRLILFGHGENSLHQIGQELARSFPDLAARLVQVVGTTADATRVDTLFRQYRPQVVFHAAAHKHVPLMEANVTEAIQNNVIGTRCIADACGRYGAERMVLISTDKAVTPSSVMGASKWLCEELLRAVAPTYPMTTYVTVRFGNVLGSRGSVVPVFREQIRQGGPVTVTHPEMTRFFMTIPEAVQLVLQAGAIGVSGDLFLLDMGKPVKIVDLARDMIRLSGLEPETDIPIVFTGLRPGEKLHEQLSTADELIQPASCAGLSIIHRRKYFSPAEFPAVLQRLATLVEADDGNGLLDYLGEIVPSFASQRLIALETPTQAMPR